ncbi:MAG: hypothetical protein ACRD3J_08530 [Thermoanaerobaculia bacterium]
MKDAATTAIDDARRHLRFGWWSLLVFATLGIVLELLHAFKVRGYLDVSNETRRLMWTLAHAHGTLLALLNVIFGLTIRVVPEMTARRRRWISSMLLVASVLIPAGFFLGGIRPYGGDPGVGVVLLPVGAALLLLALYGVAMSTMSASGAVGSEHRPGPRK